MLLLAFVLIVPTNTTALENTLKAGQVKVTTGNLNIRAKANKTSKILKTIKKDKHITLVSKSGNWWKVKYNKTDFVFCYADYIKVVSNDEKTVSLSSGNLNVRKNASLTSKIKDKLQNGEIVVILSEKGDFYKVLYFGVKTGFVSKQYLEKAVENKYEKISLQVPDFKQTDSRWAHVQIGNSGKTIGKIGCVTTAISMIESYKSSKNIYPDEMSKKLKYSSSGNVYWPSEYSVVTNSENYLEKIYDLLKQNKPVLFGAKKANGIQHWVVIKGFSGGNELYSSGFLINDPGSKSRTTLSQFLSEYPNFYKYFYY